MRILSELGRNWEVIVFELDCARASFGRPVIGLELDWLRIPLGLDLDFVGIGLGLCRSWCAI